MSKTKKSVKSIAVNCSCVSSYVSAIEALIPSNDRDNTYCFRGQAVSNWKLNSSLSRLGANADDAKKIYEDVVRNFPNEFNGLEELTFDDLAKMQHFGIPTNLIDVSFNPLVAMFFATAYGKGKNGIMSGSVYVFKISNECVKYKANDLIFDNDTKKDSLDKTYLVKTNFSNERIKKQDGAFLYISGNGKPNSIHKFLIENVNKKRIREELTRMGILSRTLFPELSEYYRNITALNFKSKNLSK